jgi:hypothetical protein
MFPAMSHVDEPELLAADPILGALYRYWNRRRGHRRMPDRRDIDPLELGPALLPHLGLMDIVEGGARVRYRLLGTAIVDRFGSDPTGKFMDEVMTGSYSDYIHGLYRELVRARAPVFSESVFRWDAEGFLRTRRLYLPLTHRAVRVADPASADAAGADAAEEVAIALIGQVFLGPATQPVQPYSVIVERAPIEQHSQIIVPNEPTANDN